MSSARGEERRAAQVPVSFRRARLEDLNALMRIERSCFHAPWPRSVMAEEILGRSCSRLEVAEEPGGVTGFMIYWAIPPEVHLLNLAVAPVSRGRGVGRALLERLLDIAPAEGADRIFLEVRASNLVARRLYLEAGFEQIDVRRGYYPDNGEDALVMYLDLV